MEAVRGRDVDCITDDLVFAADKVGGTLVLFAAIGVEKMTLRHVIACKWKKKKTKRTSVT